MQGPAAALLIRERNAYSPRLLIQTKPNVRARGDDRWA
jgi:hypothetical protein